MKRTYILGGDDLEMVVIKRLLEMAQVPFVQPHREWGEHKYGPNLVEHKVVDVLPTLPSMAGKGTPAYKTLVDCKGVEIISPIFVECEPSDDWKSFSKIVNGSVVNFHQLITENVIDHHGNQSGRKASILQVLENLEKDGFKISDYTRRWVELVAANDVGHIDAMEALGATPEEVDRIRALDRRTQGVTPWHESEAERALTDNLTTMGDTVVVRLMHSKCATITDRLHRNGDKDILIISSDGECNFYGDGFICSMLKERFSGWGGGSGFGKSGQRGYWGGKSNGDEVLSSIQEYKMSLI